MTAFQRQLALTKMTAFKRELALIIGFDKEPLRRTSELLINFSKRLDKPGDHREVVEE